MKRVLSNITEEDSYLLDNDSIENIETQQHTCFSWIYYVSHVPILLYTRLYNYIRGKETNVKN